LDHSPSFWRTTLITLKKDNWWNVYSKIFQLANLFLLIYEHAVAPKPKLAVIPKPKQAVALNPKPSTSRNCDDDQSDAKNSQSSQDEEDLVEYDEETDDEYTDEETLPSINNVRSKTAENRSTINQQQHAPQQSQPIQLYYPPQSRNIDPVEKKTRKPRSKKVEEMVEVLPIEIVCPDKNHPNHQ